MVRKFDQNCLRLGFEGDSVGQNFSFEGQDLFVLSLLNGKRGGVFLDLGCSHPIVKNNTFLLESSFGWDGLSVDIDENYFHLFVFRNSKKLAADCTILDWNQVIDLLGVTSIDYLSLDLEPPAETLKCLLSIPFGLIEFGVVTFEHDAYRVGEAVRVPSREVFEQAGYVRCCSNVKVEGQEFEDWYFNPNLVDPKRASSIFMDAVNWENIVFDSKKTP